MNDRKRGRPPKWNPQIIAGWRYAKGATIAATARKFMVSADTVKRACRDHGEGALEARQTWFFHRWLLLNDRLTVVFTKHGGYRPVVLNLMRRIDMLESACRETERAMQARCIPYTPSPIATPSPTPQASETAKWGKALGLYDDDAGQYGEWELSEFQQRGMPW